MVLLVSLSTPTECVRHTEANVTANVEGVDVQPGSGSLYVTDSNVVWLNSNGEGIQLEYKQISLHAVSRDLQAFPKEHLLMHYEGKLPGVTERNGGSESEGSDGGGLGLIRADIGEPITEIRFAPENKDSLDAMFDAIAQCQTLHPDDDCQLSDEDEGDFDDVEQDNGAGDGFFYGEEGLSQLNEEGQRNLERFNQMLQAGQGDAEITARTNQIHLTNGHDNNQEDGQFQDADDAMGDN